MNLESVSLLGQQITKVESPFQVKDGVAEPGQTCRGTS